MAKEPNQMKWRGVRPTDPEEPFTVISGTAANLKVEAAIATDQKIIVENSHIAQGSESSSHTDPLDETELEATGQLTAGIYDVTITVACDVNHYWINIGHRDAGRTTYYGVWRISTLAYSPFAMYINNWEISANDRFVLVLEGDMTGHIAVSINWVRTKTT